MVDTCGAQGYAHGETVAQGLSANLAQEMMR